MTATTHKITLCSDEGDSKYPGVIDIVLDPTQMDCPVTFWANGVPVFSLGAAEIPAFCEALSSMDCSA